MPHTQRQSTSAAILIQEEIKCARVVEILKAIAHPVRLQIIATLCEGEVNVSDLATALDVEQAIVSQQLRILRMSGLVDSIRKGGFAIYRLNEPHLKDLIACMVECCSS